MLTAWLGRADLLDPDEARHAEIAREMLAGGGFVVPHIHGQPYYDKPVLFHWLVAASLALFGHTAAAARLPSVLAAFWTLIVTWWWASRAYSREVANLAVTGLASTFVFVAIGRYAIVDMTFTAAMTTALAWLGVWYLEPAGRRRSILPFYAAVGVATLVKGPVAIVLGGLVALCLLIREKDRALLAAMRPVVGPLLVLAVAAPWYVAATLSDPQYVSTFLWQHNLGRYAVADAVTHQQPWYYYLVAIPLALLPWTPLLPSAARARLTRNRRTAADVYCTIWAGVVIAFFFPARAKLVTYVLPAYPAIACLGAAYFRDLTLTRPVTRRFDGGFASFAAAWAMSVATIAAGAAAYVLIAHPELRARTPLALLAIVSASIAFRSERRGGLHHSAAVVAVTSAVAVVVVYGLAADVVNAIKSTRPAAAIVAAELPPNADLAAYRIAPHALAFYASRVVRRTNVAGEATTGLAGDGPSALITKRKYLKPLALEPLPRDVVERWSNGDGLVLLTKRARASVADE